MPLFRHQPPACTPLNFRDIVYSSINNAESENKFSKKIKNFLGVKYIITHTSFMHSIYRCLSFLKNRNPKRNQIIVPRYSCMTFAHAIIESGLKIQYCDQNTSDLSININSLKSVSNKETLALICVNHLGLSNDMEAISNFCNKSDINLIEDLGYSFGTTYNGKKLGTFGDYSVYNFKEGKAIPIGGGMVTTNDSDFFEYEGSSQNLKSNFLRVLLYSLVIKPYSFFMFKKIMKWLKINYQRRFSSEHTLIDSKDEYRYNFDNNLNNYKLSSFQFSIGEKIFSNFGRYIQIRFKNFVFLKKALGSIKGIKVIENKNKNDKVHYIRCPILVEKNRDKLLAYLLSNNIEASEMYPEVNKDIEQFPGSKVIKNNLLTLPCHPGMRKIDLYNVVFHVKSFIFNEVD